MKRRLWRLLKQKGRLSGTSIPLPVSSVHACSLVCQHVDARHTDAPSGWSVAWLTDALLVTVGLVVVVPPRLHSLKRVHPR
jgi:hypothetical protein